MKKKIALFLSASCLLGSPAWGQPNFRAGWQKANPVAPESTLVLEEKVNVHQESLKQAPRIHDQQNFKANMENADPVKPASTISLAEKIKIHEDYLNKAVSNEDPAKQLYGALYLFTDHYNAQNYEELARYALQAENIAQKSGNPGWQGAAKLRRGKVNVVVYQDWKAAIQQYEMGEKLCLAAKDSLCAGECLANIASMYTQLGDFDKSYHYFNLAIPILKRFTNSDMAAIYNNLSNLAGRQGRQVEALKYLDTAITIAHDKKDLRLEMVLLFNSALANAALGNDDKALEIHLNCLQVNAKNKWLDNLAGNYSGMADVYAKKGAYKSAYTYINKYYFLRDSINGEEVKIKVGNLTAKYNSQQKELELQKSQTKLDAAQRTLEQGVWLLFFLLLLAGFGLLRWRILSRHAKQTLAQNQEALTDLTRVLLDKNALLMSLEEKATERSSPISPSSSPTDFEQDFYNQRILTDADWAAFKAYFEKANPGYLLRLRTVYPTLSDAEERLFLLTKLKLTRKESAAMLGISTDSIKKGRSRLRKRVELDKEADLDTFIHAF